MRGTEARGVVNVASSTYLSLFSGAGGLDLAVRLAIPRARCVGYVEIEIPAAKILAARMEDGSLDDAPIWSDVRTFPCELYRGRVAGIVGGFPCPDYSVAGKRAGIVGQHGQLWDSMRRVICEVGPQFCFLENVPGILVPHGDDGPNAGIGYVLGDLAEMGFDAEWVTLPASAVGAPHRRERWFCLAYRNQQRANALTPASRSRSAAGERSGLLEDAVRNGQYGRLGEEGRSRRRGVCEAGEQLADGAQFIGRREQIGLSRSALSAGDRTSGAGLPPRSEDSECCGNHPGAVDSLTGAAGLWTTPQAHDQAGGNPERVRRKGTEHGCANLADDVTLWSAPQARDTHNPSTEGSPRTARKLDLGWTIDLNEQAAWWMTPNVPNGGRSVDAETVANKGSTPEGKKTVGLESQTEFWTTPNQRDYKSEEGSEGNNYDRSPNLSRQVYQSESLSSLPAPRTATDGLRSSETSPGSRPPSARKRLNVYFVEALMGICPGWTSADVPIDSGALEIWLYQCRRLLRSLSLCGERG